MLAGIGLAEFPVHAFPTKSCRSNCVSHNLVILKIPNVRACLSLFRRLRGAASRVILSTAGLLVLLETGCSGLQPPATPPPHAFIRYCPPGPGDTSLRLGVKDLIDMRGQVTSAGSEYLYKHAPPAKRDADCLKLARKPGITIVGKTNLSEFAVGVTGSNDFFGTPVNPIDPRRVPGGSSSGSAVAVADNLADVALGTDTAGSIRVPAACCGIAGLKTTFGLISTKGVYPIAPRYLDTVGPMAKDVAGLVRGMEMLQAGFQDLYAKARRAKPTAEAITIGRLYIPKTDPAIDRAIDKCLADAGFRILPVSRKFLTEWEQAQRDGNLVAAAATWRNNQELQHESGRRAKLAIWFGDLVFSRKYKNEAERQAAVVRRDAWRRTLGDELKQVDAIALPVLRKAPPAKSTFLPGLSEGAFLGIQNTVAVNYAGAPALALPVPMPGQPFPVTSLQLVGPGHSEAALLNVGRLIEEQAAKHPGR